MRAVFGKCPAETSGTPQLVRSGAETLERRATGKESLFGVLPLCVMLALLFVCIGDERVVATHFATVKALYPSAARLLAWFSAYGNIPFYACYAYIAYRSLRNGKKEDARFIFCYAVFLLLLLLIADVLKIWIGRPRPGVAGEYVFMSLRKAQHSFPSNHVLETTFTLLALARYVRRRGFTLLCGLSLAVMALTRLFLGRHHPTDILGSALIGYLWVHLLWRVTTCHARCPAYAAAHGRADAAGSNFFRRARPIGYDEEQP